MGDTMRAYKAKPMKMGKVRGHRVEADLLRALGKLGCMVVGALPVPCNGYRVIFPHRFTAQALLAECRARKWDKQAARLFPADLGEGKEYFVVRGRLFATINPHKGEVNFTLD